jgi:hypothetical protein
MRNPLTGGKTTSGDVMTNDDESFKRSDLQMLCQGIRNNWDLPKDAFKSIPARLLPQLMEAIESRNKGERDALLKTILVMHADNMKDIQHLERLEQSDRHHRDKMADDKPTEIVITRKHRPVLDHEDSDGP